MEKHTMATEIRRAQQRRTQLNALKRGVEGVASAGAFQKVQAAEKVLSDAVTLIAGLVDDLEGLEGVTYG